MQIVVTFRFNHEDKPSAVSGIEGDVADVLLPQVGDLVSHTDSGKPFTGRVTERSFLYELPEGRNIDGRINVTLCLDRTTLQ